MPSWSEPPQVFLATDVDVLHRVLAAELVSTPSDVLTSSETEAIRRALLDERWGDAVLAWIDLMGIEVDVYTHLHVYTGNDLPEEHRRTTAVLTAISRYLSTHALTEQRDENHADRDHG